MFHTSDVYGKKTKLGHSIFAKLIIFMPRYAYMKDWKKLFLDRKTIIYKVPVSKFDALKCLVLQ